MKNFTLTLILACIAFIDIAHAQITNPKISVQGILREASGVAVEDGEYDLTFKIYNQLDGGTALYEEDHEGVVVANGIYSVHIGTHVSMGFLPFDEVYYVGVTVGTNELKPRVELTHSPYSMAARSVSCSGAVGDVKYSILDWDDFQVANGDCWVPMDGRDVTGTALEQEFGMSTVPDMSGLFMRAQEWNDGNDPDRTPSSPVATIQNDEIQEHSHNIDITTSSDGSHSHDFNDSFFSDFDQSDNGNSSAPVNVDIPRSGASPWLQQLYDTNNDLAKFTNTLSPEETATEGDHTHDVIGTSENMGGAETRPKNMNFYIYIRVN